MFEFLQYAEKTAVITDKGERLSYAQLFDEVERFGWQLTERGLILCLCKNEIGSLIGYLSGINQGYPLVLLDGGRDNGFIHLYIKHYLPEYVWTPSERCHEFGGSVIYERYGYSLIRTGEGHVPLNDDLALCLTTSGSTGSPKLVRLTMRNLESNARSIASYLTISDNERPITSLPMFYSYGLSVINSHLIKGATILLTNNSIFSKSFWDFFESASPSSIAGVPFTYEMLERMGFFKMDLPSLKTMIQAGGKLNAEIVDRYIRFARETNRQFIVMYGQTEASPRMSYLPFDEASTRPSSIGIAIPGGEFLLYDNDGNTILESGVEGELIYKGENVCMGYAESWEDLIKGDENNGVLKTGDMAYRDSDGFYYITGRRKRFVKIWGNRYNLDSIEQMIKPITTECACLGDDSCIHVVVADASFVGDITHLLSKTLQLDKSCYSVSVVDQIPKSPSGKIQYVDLKKALNL